MLCITLGGQLFEISVQTKMLTEHVAVSLAVAFPLHDEADQTIDLHRAV